MKACVLGFSIAVIVTALALMATHQPIKITETRQVVKAGERPKCEGFCFSLPGFLR